MEGFILLAPWISLPNFMIIPIVAAIFQSGTKWLTDQNSHRAAASMSKTVQSVSSVIIPTL